MKLARGSGWFVILLTLLIGIDQVSSTSQNMAFKEFKDPECRAHSRISKEDKSLGIEDLKSADLLLAAKVNYTVKDPKKSYEVSYEYEFSGLSHSRCVASEKRSKMRNVEYAMISPTFLNFGSELPDKYPVGTRYFISENANIIEGKPALAAEDFLKQFCRENCTILADASREQFQIIKREQHDDGVEHIIDVVYENTSP